MFDYESAWSRWAVEELKRLPHVVLELERATIVEAENISQDDKLDMPWPSDEFRERFRAVDTEVLAKASRVLYFLGHWAPTGKVRKDGSHWKFSKYCDQTLLERFPKIAHRRGYGLLIHQGAMRLTYSSNYEWRWDELGLPREEMSDELRRAVNRLTNTEIEFDEAYPEILKFMGDQEWFGRYRQIIKECGA